MFNLGATMYWMLTSENYPTEIRGDDTPRRMKGARSSKPLAPVEHNDKIPVSLSNLVMECCRDNPADRPGGMKQVISRLDVVQKLWSKYRTGIKSQQVAPLADEAEEAQELSAEDDA